MKLSIRGQAHQVEVAPDLVIVDGEPLKVQVSQASGGATTVQVEGRPYHVEIKERNGTEIVVEVDGTRYAVAWEDSPTEKAAPPTATVAQKEEKAPVCDMPLLNAVQTPIPGRILAIKVREGQRVTAGTVLCILEAMKMENEIRAPKDGVVSDIRVSEGMSVNGNDILMQVC